ncbi:MAG: polyamine aminopropyltransferase [Cytophagales bacterium]|nr:polyamine aminopropyltransferase [Cytophagales bacterium]
MKLKSNVLKLCLFATGLSGIVAEYILSTLATYFLGDSVFQFTMIMSIMLFSMGLGSRLSKFIHTDLLKAFVGVEFLLSLIVSFVSILTYLTAAFTSYTGLTIYLLSIIVGLFIGMEIPLVIRLNDQFEELKVNVSSIMEKDYYGSLLGGVFFAFIGLPYLGLTYTPFVLGTVNLLVALLLLAVLWKQAGARMQRQLGTSAVLVVLLIAGGVNYAKEVVKYGEEKRYKDPVIFSEQTPYQRIVITESGKDFWLFINGNQQLSSIDEGMYHEPLVHPVMGLLKNPQKVLVLGGGDGCAVREILKYPSVEEIVLVDLDPAMTKVASEHPLLSTLNQRAFSHPKVRIVNADGFTYMEQDRNFYDAVIIDLPDPKSVELGRLYSFEFYRMCYNRLRPHGVITTQAGSPYYAAEAFQCIDLSMEKAGFTTAPLHNQVVTLGEWGWVLGVKQGSKEQLKRRLQNLKFGHLPVKYISQEAMQLMTSFGKPLFLEGKVRVNRIHDPVLYRYYLDGDWDIY